MRVEGPGAFHADGLFAQVGEGFHQCVRERRLARRVGVFVSCGEGLEGSGLEPCAVLVDA